MLCGNYDGKIWKESGKAYVPVVHSHAMCRCNLVPVVRGHAPSARVSYKDWFAGQDAAMQREILGPTRYKLYSAGGYKLPDFVSSRGVRSVRSLLAAARAAA